ncbi:zinc finger, CCHC-type containing protein [Tanacetum coccineum]
MAAAAMSVVYVLTTPIPEDGGDDPIVEQVRKRNKWDNDDYVCRGLILKGQIYSRGLILNGMSDSLFDIYHNVESSKEMWVSLEAKYVAGGWHQVSCIIDKLPPSWKDFKHILKHLKEELTLVELGSHLRIEESLGMQDSDKPKGNNVAGPLVFNMCGKPGHLKKDCKGEKGCNKANGSGTNGSSRCLQSLKGQNMVNKSFQVYYVTDVSEAYFVQDDDVAWWVDSGATVYVCKDRCLFKTYESLNDGSILHMGNESTVLVHRCGCVDLKFSSGKIVSLFNACMLNIVNDNIGSAFMSTSKLNDSILWHARLGHDEALDKFKVFKTEVELQQGSQIKRFRTDKGGEYMDTLYFQAIVRLPDPQLKTLGERGIECIFVGYAEHSKAFRYYVIEPNDSVVINSIIKSRDTIFDENRFSLVPRPSLSIPKGTKDFGCLVVPKVVTDEVVQQPESKLRKSKRNRTPKDFGPEFQLYLIEGTRDEVSDQHSYCFNVEDDPKTFDEAMKSQDIFKRKLKVDGTIEKFKARLVIQDFKQKSGIDYFDTYALVARISTIRLLIAMASIHNLIIHQMDVKTTFLNGDLDAKVYMNQPQVFIMPGNENKVCKLIKSLYRLKQTPKQWNQKFDEVVLSNGYLLNQADKCVYSKFDKSGKGVIICLYVDNMLIFSTYQVQVDLTKEFLSSKFSMKDMGEVDVILDIRIKHGSNGIAISQSYYIEKAVSQLEYSRVIDCLMYAITCTRSDIAFSMGKLSRYTSNPGTQHWQAIQRVLKYLKKTMDYRLTYTSYPSVLEGYTDASWISNTEDNLSTSGWVFLLSAAGKEAEWLKNLLLEIQLWSKPITPISIRYDSVVTLAKAYS